MTNKHTKRSLTYLVPKKCKSKWQWDIIPHALEGLYKKDELQRAPERLWRTVHVPTTVKKRTDSNACQLMSGCVPCGMSVMECHHLQKRKAGWHSPQRGGTWEAPCGVRGGGQTRKDRRCAIPFVWQAQSAPFRRNRTQISVCWGGRRGSGEWWLLGTGCGLGVTECPQAWQGRWLHNCVNLPTCPAPGPKASWALKSELYHT